MGRKIRTQHTNRRPAKKVPMWAPYVIVISITIMLCLSINYRAFSTMTDEVREYEQLTTRIQSIADENLQLQDEIHELKSNASVIEREARRLGIARRQEKVSVPTN